MVDSFLELINSPGFVSFLATYGLATLIVIYIIFFRDPRRHHQTICDYRDLKRTYEQLNENFLHLSHAYTELRKSLEEKYKEEFDHLSQSYEELKEAYEKLEHDLKPETRSLSEEQAASLAEVGLDRDLYKLYYYICQKLDGKRVEDLDFFISDSIRKTNQAWAQFISPFPQVPCISDLYGVYKNHGGSLKRDLALILEDSDYSEEEKRNSVWNKLLNDTLEMKREFDGFIRSHRQHKEVHVYQESQ